MKKSSLFEKIFKKRKEIDLIDQKLLNLLNRRFQIAIEIGRIKKQLGKNLYDPKREKEILESLKRKNRGPLREEEIKKIFHHIIKICRRSQAGESVK